MTPTKAKCHAEGPTYQQNYAGHEEVFLSTQLFNFPNKGHHRGDIESVPSPEVSQPTNREVFYIRMVVLGGSTVCRQLQQIHVYYSAGEGADK